MKIFATMQKSSYDATGLNREWLTSISVDERSLIKKFFRDSGPQFQNMGDYWMEEFCRRLQAVTYGSGKVLKQNKKEPDELFIIIKGKVSVYAPKFKSKDETLLLNEYWPGQSFGDPLLNETTSAATTVKVTCSKNAKFFVLSRSSYMQVYIDKLNELNKERFAIVKEHFQPFNTWDESRLKNLL